MSSPPSSTEQSMSDHDILKSLVESSGQLLDKDTLQIHKNLDSVFEHTRKLGERIPMTMARVTGTSTALGAVEPLGAPTRYYPGVEWGRGGPAAGASQGELLLASKGMAVDKYKRQLKAIDLSTAFEPIEPLAETDIQGYLKHEHNMIILTAIEEAKKLTSNHFYKHHENYLNSEWQESKKNLLRMLEFHKGAFRGEAPQLQQSGISRYQPQPEPFTGIEQRPAFVPGRRGRSNMDSRMREYAAVVYQLNQVGIRGEYFPLVQRFMQCAEVVQERDTRKRDVLNSWDILKTIVNEPEIEKRGVARQFRRYEASEEEDLVKNARRYLEGQYARFIEERVASTRTTTVSTTAASATVDDDKLDLIDKFIAAHMHLFPPNLESNSDGKCTWARVYFCLRCGFREQARELLEKIPDSANLISCLEEQQSVDTFMQHVRTAARQEIADAFKKTVYIVLGKEHNETPPKTIITTSEDYVWIKLSIISRQYALKDLQTSITQPGPAHFQTKQRASLLYFKLLLLTLQFEEAVHHLCMRDLDNGYQVEAVHMAIAINYYGLLNLPNEPNDPLLTTGRDGRKRLNIYFLLKDYVKIFAHTDPRDAVSYLNLVGDESLRLNYLKELVVQSKDPSTLVGYIDMRARRRDGCCSEFLNARQMVVLLHESAAEYDRTGRYSVAVDMYFMAEEYSRSGTGDRDSDYGADLLRKVLMTINRELSQVLIDGDNRPEVMQLAKKVRIKFDEGNLFQNRLSNTQNDKRLKETFDILNRLAHFFDKYQAKQWDQAFTIMFDELRLLPFDQSMREECVNRFNRDLDDTVKRKIADIILATFDIVYQLFDKTRRTPSPNQAQELRKWKQYARNLIIFCPFIQSYLSTNTYEKMISMDQNMSL